MCILQILEFMNSLHKLPLPPVAESIARSCAWVSDGRIGSSRSWTVHVNRCSNKELEKQQMDQTLVNVWGVMSISAVTSECWCDCSGSSFPEVPKISFSFWWHCFFYPGLCFFVVVVVIVYFPKWALSKTKYMYVVPSSGSGEFQSGWTGRDALYVCVCTESLLGEKEMEPLGFVFDFSADRGHLREIDTHGARLCRRTRHGLPCLPLARILQRVTVTVGIVITVVVITTVII